MLANAARAASSDDNTLPMYMLATSPQHVPGGAHHHSAPLIPYIFRAPIITAVVPIGNPSAMSVTRACRSAGVADSARPLLDDPFPTFPYAWDALLSPYAETCDGRACAGSTPTKNHDVPGDAVLVSPSRAAGQKPAQLAWMGSTGSCKRV